MLSGGSLGAKALPELKKNSVNLNRVLGVGAQGSAGSDGSNQRLRKASPEALALMMANIKKND